MANFKTVIRLAKLPWYKISFRVDGLRVVNADNNVMVWSPCDDPQTRDVDDEPAELLAQVNTEEHGFLLPLLSPDLGDMVKVNSSFLRRAMAALETGNNPIYIDIKEKRICLAYEADGVINRAAVATMENRHGTDN